MERPRKRVKSGNKSSGGTLCSSFICNGGVEMGNLC